MKSGVSTRRAASASALGTTLPTQKIFIDGIGGSLAASPLTKLSKVPADRTTWSGFVTRSDSASDLVKVMLRMTVPPAIQ